GREVGRALEEIANSIDALPRNGNARCVHNRCRHQQYGTSIRRYGSRAPFLPIVQTVMVGVAEIRCAIGWQSVLLQPGVGNQGTWGGKLVSADINCAGDDAQVAI